MARKRTYDEAEVRRGLVGAFLTNGYADSSLSELESASGLDRRQLYNGFGDKKALFVQALDDFVSVADTDYLGPLNDGQSGIAAIRGLLMFFVEQSQTARGRLGCLVCNTAREGIAHDPDIQPRIKYFFEKVERAYASALTVSAERGEIVLNAAEIASRARLLLGTHVSLCTLARAGMDQAILQDMAEETLKTLT